MEQNRNIQEETETIREYDPEIREHGPEAFGLKWACFAQGRESEPETAAEKRIKDFFQITETTGERSLRVKSGIS